MKNLGWDDANQIAQEIIWELEEYGMLRMALAEFEWPEREALINSITAIIHKNRGKAE